MTGKYGIPYFNNMLNSDMNPEDVRSMCCRLNLDLRELRKRGGGLFGSGENTGSIGVVTLDLPRFGYQAETKEELLSIIEEYMELAKDSLERKRDYLNKYVLGTGLIPAYDEYVGPLRNHFSTIGLVGMNEMCQNFLEEGIASQEGHQLSLDILDFMREKCKDFQEETENFYNLEATPAESTAYKLAKRDKEKYQDIYTKQGDNEEVYYTNSCHMPVDKVQNLKHLFEHQNELQPKFTGGTVIHSYLDGGISGEQAKHIIKTACENYKAPYISLTPVHSICEEHGYISGFVETCPICGKEVASYQRITGYIRQIDNFNPGKQAEFYDRNQLGSEIND